MDQVNYRYVDRPAENQVHGPGTYNYPPETSNIYPQCYNNDLPSHHDLNHPLIDHNSDKKNKHQHRIKIKKRISILISSVCPLIETLVIVFLKKNSSIFKYCYWNFGLYYYWSDVRQQLPAGNGRGWSSNVFYDLECPDKEKKFPECSSICELAYDVKIRMKSINFILGFSDLIMFTLLVLLISSYFDKRIFMNKLTVSCFTLLSYIIILGYWVYYAHQLDFINLSEPDMSKVNITSGMDEPTGLEVNFGGVIIMLLIPLMLFYRIVLICLAESKAELE